MIRTFATRYSYNKTIPQTFFSKESVILSYEHEKKQSEKRIPKDILRTKKGLASGAALSAGSFYKRNIRYDDKDNRIEDVLTVFDRPFYDLCRDDLWILDPLSLTVTS